MQYHIVITFPMEAVDDLQARAKARALLAEASPDFGGIGRPVKTKLQAIYARREPRTLAGSKNLLPSRAQGEE